MREPSAVRFVPHAPLAMQPGPPCLCLRPAQRARPPTLHTVGRRRSVWRLATLLELNVARNRLCALPAVDARAGAPPAALPLVELCVARNRLAAFDDSLAAALPSLTRLDVGHNALVALPAGLSSLRFVLAHHNRLGSLAPLGSCHRLLSLLARANPLPPGERDDLVARLGSCALGGAAAELELEVR